jgi:glycosyltransferase involved in cell wall biosynthesis
MTSHFAGCEPFSGRTLVAEHPRILILNTSDTRGGAAKAAFRLYQGLKGMGAPATMMVADSGTGDETIAKCVPEDDRKPGTRGLMDFIQQRYIEKNRAGDWNTIFSSGLGGTCDRSILNCIQDYDVINLHWIVDMLSLDGLIQLFMSVKPVVWTLHDMWPFTGGCHYDHECRGFRENCWNCPLLRFDPRHVPGRSLKLKAFALLNANMAVVAPSAWLAEEAGKSLVFRGKRIEVIPNSIDLALFFPVDKTSARKLLGIPEKKTILFSVFDAREKRKGFQHLIELLRYLRPQRTVHQRLQWGGSLPIDITCRWDFGYTSDQEKID